MPVYSYKAINERGTVISGTMDADSADAAKSILAENNLIPTKVHLQRSMESNAYWERFIDWVRPVKMPDLIMFTKQFRTLIRAGIPILSLLQSLETQTEDTRLKKVILAINHDVSQGSSLHDAFGRHPNVFSNLYISMVNAGESSGALPEVLERLIYILEHEHKIRTDIRSALQYPIFVLVFLCVAFFILLTYVIPKFSAIFNRSGMELPLLTRICIDIYDFLMNYWFLIAAALIIAIASIIYYIRTDKGRLFKDKILLAMPILGTLFQKAAMARFASIFSILQSSGVGVLESIGILIGTIHNRAITQEFERLTERLEEGRGIAEPLRQSNYFTPIVVNMTAIGEETGNLEEMMNDIAAHYDWELEHAVKRFNESLGPILILGMAAVIGFFALAIYLPMWDLSQVVQ